MAESKRAADVFGLPFKLERMLNIMMSLPFAGRRKTPRFCQTFFARVFLFVATVFNGAAAFAIPSVVHLSTNWPIASDQAFVLQFTNAVAADAESDTVIVLLATGQVVASTGFAPMDVPAGLSNVVGLSCGFGVNEALKSDGTIFAWGGNEFGQDNIPKGYSNALAVAPGWWHVLGLQSNGVVSSWGRLSTVPSGLSNVVAIAAGQQRSVALQANGTVVEWGPNAYPVPSSFTNIIAIASDFGGDLALTADGKVYEWSSSFTNALPGIANAVAIAGDSDLYLVLEADGSVVSGGSNPLLFGETLSNAFSISVGQFINSGTVITGDGSPVFKVQPGNQTVSAGGTIWLHARAVGSQPMSYQWQINGTNLPGATNADLTINGATAANSGQYRALASNEMNQAESLTASVTVQTPIPLLLSPPSRQPDGSWLVNASAASGSLPLISDPSLVVFQASADLVNWLPLTNAVIFTNGGIQIRDQQNVGPERFYRVFHP